MASESLINPPSSGPLRPPLRPQPDAATLRRLYRDEGRTVAGVAAALGISNGAAHKHLRAAGVPLRPALGIALELDDEAMRRLYSEERWSAAAIAAHLGCGTNTVYDRLRRLGVARRPRSGAARSSRPPADVLRRLYVDDQLSLRQIATKLSVTPQAVHGWLKAAGISRRPPTTRRPPQADDDLGKLYQAGWSGPALAHRYGCAPATIYRRLQRAGIPRRRRDSAVARTQLLDGLDAGQSASAMAAAFGVSVTSICRALAREGLQTPTQQRRSASGQRYRELLELADRSNSVDEVSRAWLRRRLSRATAASA